MWRNIVTKPVQSLTTPKAVTPLPPRSQSLSRSKPRQHELIFFQKLRWYVQYLFSCSKSLVKMGTRIFHRSSSLTPRFFISSSLLISARSLFIKILLRLIVRSNLMISAAWLLAWEIMRRSQLYLEMQRPGYIPIAPGLRRVVAFSSFWTDSLGK